MRFFLTSEIGQLVAGTVEKAGSQGIWSKAMMLQYLQDSIPTILNFLVKLIIAIIVLLVGRKIIQFVRKMILRFMEKTITDTGVRQFFDRLINLFLHFALIMIVLGKFGITASSVIAVIGSVGLSIGLALQGSLSNFAGGVLILLLKPFKVGDYIVEDSHGNEGVVTEIQLFYTKLLTIDNRTVVIPNGTLSNSSLTNVTQQEKRRIDFIVGISYHADIKTAKNAIQDVIFSDPDVLTQEDNVVYVDSLGDSSVNIGIRAWVKTENYWTARWRMIENVKYKLDEANIEIPFPQVTISGECNVTKE